MGSGAVPAVGTNTTATAATTPTSGASRRGRPLLPPTNPNMCPPCSLRGVGPGPVLLRPLPGQPHLKTPPVGACDNVPKMSSGARGRRLMQERREIGLATLPDALSRGNHLSKVVRRRQGDTMGSKLPPGPDSPRLLATLKWQRDATTLVETAQGRYGDIWTMRL